LYLGGGIDGTPSFINTDGDVLKLNNRASSDYTVDNKFETGWLSLNGDPNSDKRVVWIKLIGDFRATMYLDVYTDFSSTPTTKTISGSSNRVIFESISVLAKVIKIGIRTTSNNNTSFFKLQDMEIKFHDIENR